jgi:hypothetical protein
MNMLTTYTNKYARLFPGLNERSKRLIAAADADVLGYGGITLVHQASGLDYKTIKTGRGELKEEHPLPPDRCRRPGGGRKKILEKDKTLAKDLKELVKDTTRGDPESPLKWTTKSTRNLAQELQRQQHQVSHMTVSNLLKDDGYSLQANSKTNEGKDHPDRDEQFRYINKQAKDYLFTGDPLISVDTKKKELVGKYKNNGQIWLPQGRPIAVNTHDFPDKKNGKAAPYGVYDINNNQGYVNVGITHDTAEFAVESIRRWWRNLGEKNYPNSRRILITADAGGSNSYRTKLWKKELQKFANETKLKITVAHFPPGTSKWNKIEHRLFSFISTNWKGRPLTNYQVIIDLIAATKTATGLKVYAVLDKNKYELKKQVSAEEMAGLNLEPHKFHGEWNYTIRPKK